MRVLYSFIVFAIFTASVTVSSAAVLAQGYEDRGQSVILPVQPNNNNRDDFDDMNEEDRIALAANIYNQLPPEDQTRLLEESNQVQSYCQGRELFATFHDCECVAMKFMEERILKPDLKKNAINVADDVADRCPNIPGAAGYGYTKCMEMYARRLPLGREEFCTCYGSAFADAYKDDARSFMPNIRKKMTNALLYCDGTGMPSPLNPDR